MWKLSLLGLLLAIFTLCTAFSGDSPFHVSQAELLRRQQKGSSSAPSSSASPSASNSDNSRSSLRADKTTALSASGTKASSSGTIVYDPRLPAGGAAMITPGVLAGAQYYKIGDWVTFAWNYTSVLATPKQVDILATCSANQATYTLALNQTYEPVQNFLWDTNEFQQTATIPLLTETYTLIVYDAASSMSAAPQAGYLGVFNSFSFGMYVPQPYVPLDEFQCATCGSGAISAIERQTLGFLLGVSGITVLTFTWFANSFGLF